MNAQISNSALRLLQPGLNALPPDTERYLVKANGALAIKQAKAIKKLRSSRDNKKVEKILSKIQSAAETDENLMPHILDAVKSYATTGEISNTFREVFGEYRPKEVF